MQTAGNTSLVTYGSQTVPCFPSSKTKVVEPEPPQYKTVNRYGETNIRHLDARSRDMWQSNNKYQARHQSVSPRHPVYDEPHQLRRQPEAHLSSRTFSETQRSTGSQSVRYRSPRSDRGPPNYQAPAPPGEETTVRHRPPKPKTADFFVSVPIFNETMDHSYRKKNTYVYRDSARDSDAQYHQTLTRASSLHSLDSSGRHRPRSGQVTSYKKRRSHRRPQSAHIERDQPAELRRSGKVYSQTLPMDSSHGRRRKHRESRYVDENRRPYSAQIERQRPEVYHRQPSGREYLQQSGEYYLSPRPKHVSPRPKPKIDDDYYGPVYIRPSPNAYQKLQRRHKTLSEASYNARPASARSFGSVYSYESERFERAQKLRKAPSSIGISVDSDEEDYR